MLPTFLLGLSLYQARMSEVLAAEPRNHLGQRSSRSSTCACSEKLVLPLRAQSPHSPRATPISGMPADPNHEI